MAASFDIHDVVREHLVCHFGAISALCLREIVGELDIHVVPGTRDRPCIILATSGARVGNQGCRYELLLYLPVDWKINDLANEENYWPIRWLRELAHYEGAVTPGDTFTNGEPPEPLSSATRMTSFVFLPEPNDYGSITCQNGGPVEFLDIVPLYTEEVELERRIGTFELVSLFQTRGVTLLVDPNRVNVGI